MRLPPPWAGRARPERSLPQADRCSHHDGNGGGHHGADDQEARPGRPVFGEYVPDQTKPGPKWANAFAEPVAILTAMAITTARENGPAQEVRRPVRTAALRPCRLRSNERV